MDCSRLRSVISARPFASPGDSLLGGIVASSVGGNVAGSQVQHRFELKRREHRVLAENTRADAADVRCGETISGAADLRAARPGYFHSQAARIEVDRGRRI